MDLAVSEAYGRVHLSDLCEQNQPIQVEQEGPSSRAIGLSNSTRGLSYSPLITPVQKFPPYNPYFCIEDAAILEEEIQSLLQKQAICQIPAPTEGLYSNMFIVPKKDGVQRPVINLKHLTNL